MASKPSFRALRALHKLPQRCYSSPSAPLTSPFSPRHLLSISDLSPSELTTLVRNAYQHKTTIKSGGTSELLQGALAGKSVAMPFSKRSTRTRVSTEAAVATMGGHPMYLGADQIQLGVNESLYDTSVVISSMVSAIVARVGPHSDVTGLAKNSTVPVINALSEDAHPMQTIADFLTIHEAFQSSRANEMNDNPGLGLEGLKIAWIGDSNNVLYDLACGAAKLGVHVSIATPKGYEMPGRMSDMIQQAGADAKSQSKFVETNVPEEAVQDADVLVTDTWVSMGQEEEKVKRLRDFEGYQITNQLAQKGGAKPGWKFMHCLPRHQEEVSDEVFYSPRSLVFPEAENRLWSAVSILEAFVAPRRSNASLKHLALSPLTTEPTISPSSPPNRSPSHSYLASPSYPTTPTVLSRSTSRTRLRPARSGPQPINTSLSSPTLTKRPAHSKRSSTNATPTLASPVLNRRKADDVGDEESSWLLRTASTLQMQRLEEKGQGWLATRNSSTSLERGDEYSAHAVSDEREFGVTSPGARSVVTSRYASQHASRYASRVPSRLGSRVGSRAGSGTDLRRDGLGALTSINQGEVRGMEGPDFVDPAVFDEEDDGGSEGEEVDEGEMRRVVMGRARGWVDWAVGWMDFRGEEEWEGSDVEGDVEGEGEERDADGGWRRRRKGKNASGRLAEIERSEKAVAGPAPQGRDDGLLADARWLVGVAYKIIV